jgi:hypothetical protein
MTLDQLSSLSDDELGMLLHIVNVRATNNKKPTELSSSGSESLGGIAA